MMFVLYVTVFFVLFRMSFEYFQLGIRNKQGEEPGWGIYNSTLIYFEYVMDIFFLVDFLIQFRTAYFARRGRDEFMLITHPPSIVLRWIPLP